jgi:hypothetical protein
MVLFTKVIGKIITHMAKASFAILLGMSTKEIGSGTEPMVMAYTRVRMVEYTEVNG